MTSEEKKILKEKWKVPRYISRRFMLVHTLPFDNISLLQLHDISNRCKKMHLREIEYWMRVIEKRKECFFLERTIKKLEFVKIKLENQLIIRGIGDYNVRGIYRSEQNNAGRKKRKTSRRN